MMKRLLASTGFLAALLLASPAAQAQYQFDYGGRTIRIDPDRGTVSIPGVYDNTGRRQGSHNDRDSARPPKQPPDQPRVDPQVPPATPADQAPAATAAPADTSAAAPSTTANIAP